MRQYGANKATEFSKKQIGVIYSAAKRGQIKMEKWVANELYTLADYYGYDDNGMVAFAETKVLNILEAVFAKDWEKAQDLLDAFTESEFNSFSEKARAKLNRALVG